MIIIGDELIEHPSFKKIGSLDEIRDTTALQVLVIDSLDIAKHCKDNNLSYLMICSSEKDAIYANSLNASYILSSDIKLASKIQKIAENYMFDAKNIILAPKNNFYNIVKICEDNNTYVDGIFFEEYFKTI